MRKTWSFLILLLFISTTILAQPQLEWEQSLGGTSADVAKCIQQTSDGDYIVAGYSNSFNGDVVGNHGLYDCWIAGLDESGDLSWQNSLGGSNTDKAEFIKQTYDKGYIIAGNTQSNDGDVSGHHGDYDFWAVKLDSTGTMDWQKCLGGSEWDYAYACEQTIDSGYVMTGNTFSNDGDVSGNHGSYDYWVVKMNADGDIEWQNCLGGGSSDEAYSIQQTSDDGFIVAGYSMSDDGDVSGNNGMADYWIVKLDAEGELQWQKCLGGTSYDEAASVRQTSDEGYIVTGFSSSEDGDVSDNYGYNDYWVVKLNNSGEITWQQNYGGSDDDYGRCIRQTTDGGYVMTGRSRSNDGNVTGNHGNYDYWVVKLNSSGSLSWQDSFGGSAHDWGHSVRQTSGEDYIVAGESQSADGDITDSWAYKDYWIAKLSPTTTGIGFTKNKDAQDFTITASPNPFYSQTDIVFTLPQSGAVELAVYDINGRSVKTLTEQKYQSGQHKLNWNTRNDAGHKVTRGIYFYQLRVNGQIKAVQKGILIK